MQTLTLGGARQTQRLVASVIAAIALAVIVTLGAVHWADSGAGTNPAPIRTAPSSHTAVPQAPPASADVQPAANCRPHLPC